MITETVNDLLQTLKHGKTLKITAFKTALVNDFEVRTTKGCIKPYVVLTNGAAFLKTRKELKSFFYDLNKYHMYDIDTGD